MIPTSLETSQKDNQTRIMMLESTERKTAKEVYKQYQKLRKFYYQEPETAN